MNISLSSIKKSLAWFIGRFHVVIFVVSILGGLVVVILLLHNVILTSSDSAGYIPEGLSSSFDQATIDRVEQLKTRAEENSELVLPQGRIDPFVE